jgi:glycosyltransferase involved in cell wall biosynthesis
VISIIIPARLNSEILKNTLKKILNQTFREFEIIVVLDFETENLFKNEKIKYIFSGIKSPGDKRNIGVENSVGEIIAFLDDDAYPSIEWLYNAQNILNTNLDYIGVCGPSLTPDESTLLEKIGGYIYESFLASGPTRFRHLALKHRLVEDYPSVNLIVRKKAFVEVGGFDTKYWPGEDTKFCLDLTNKFGKKIYYSPLLIVFHFRRNVFHPHLIQLSRYASHRGYFAKKFPKTSFKLSYFIPTFFLIYLLIFPLFIYLYPKNQMYYFIPLLIYFFIMAYDIVRVYFKSSSLAVSIITAMGIFISNLTYGLFFLKGLFTKPELVLREVDIVNEKYIKG